MEPHRVPMGRPSCGVKPMEVSTASPYLTAEMEEPLPMWQVTIFSCSSGLPTKRAASAET